MIDIASLKGIKLRSTFKWNPVIARLGIIRAVRARSAPLSFVDVAFERGVVVVQPVWTERGGGPGRGQGGRAGVIRNLCYAALRGAAPLAAVG